MQTYSAYRLQPISGTVRRTVAFPVVGRRLHHLLLLTRNARQMGGTGVRARDAAFPAMKRHRHLRLRNAPLTANGVTLIILAIRF
jgi:hypothetical protein